MNNNMNKTQEAAYELIRFDAKYLCPLILNFGKIENNWIFMALPYIGIFADGSEEWGKKLSIGAPLFTHEEQRIYEATRQKHKLFNLTFSQLHKEITHYLKKSDDEFSSMCKPIARQSKIYYNYGVDYYSSSICGNTILCKIYNEPYTDDGVIWDRQRIYNITSIAGKLVRHYGGLQAPCFTMRTAFRSGTKDFHFPENTDIKIKEAIGFTLFSIFCSINYVIHFLNDIIIEEAPMKLRAAYLQYYYLVDLVEEMNKLMDTNFELNRKWHNVFFRNCMAHYGLGQSIKDSDVNKSDLLFGISIKYFNMGYEMFKQKIFDELKILGNQLADFLF